MPPLHDIAHLAHVELLTDKPEECLDFYVRYLGMTENGTDGDSVFLRAWDDYENTTVKLTAAAQPGVGRTNFRASTPEALQRRVAAIEATGLGIGWQDGDPGYGPVYVFTDPDGHEMGVTTRRSGIARPATCAGAEEPGPGLSRPRRERPADRPHQLPRRRSRRQPGLRRRRPRRDGHRADRAGRRGRRQLDHVHQQGLRRGLDPGQHRHVGRLHHLSFAVDSRDDVLRAADLALEHGIHIETGPHKHTIQQSFFLYIWDPAGNRIELDNPGARLVFAPDWQPIDWSAAERAKGQAWGLQDHLDVPHPRHAAGPGGGGAPGSPSSVWGRRAR